MRFDATLACSYGVRVTRDSPNVIARTRCTPWSGGGGWPDDREWRYGEPVARGVTELLDSQI
ncbi:hypothetical protein GCM10027089_42030 [Nocardia thraciensis]